MAKRYIEADKLLKDMEVVMNDTTCPLHIAATIDQTISLAETADVVPRETVEQIFEKISIAIIRKKAATSDYWLRDVKRYRATQGYSDIEHDADNFLRGYGEAVDDILAILDEGEKKYIGEQNDDR